MREFMSIKENINIIEFMEASNMMDEYREQRKEKQKHGKK